MSITILRKVIGLLYRWHTQPVSTFKRIQDKADRYKQKPGAGIELSAHLELRAHFLSLPPLYEICFRWFRNRPTDTSGLDDWIPDVVKLGPNGLASVYQILQEEAGEVRTPMRLGLWVEPEMCSPGSNVFREHPDWVSFKGSGILWSWLLYLSVICT